MRVQGLEVMGKGFSDPTAKEMMTHPTKYEQTEATKIAKVTPQNKTSGKGPTAPIKVQYGEAMVTEAIVEEKPAISESKGKGKMEMNIPSTEDEGHRVGQNYRRTMGGPTAPISQKVNNVKRQEEKPYLSVQQSAANFCGMGRTSDAEEPKFGLGYKEWAKRKRLSGPIFIPSKETVEAWQNNVGTNKKYLKAPEPTWVTTNKNKAGKAPAKENVVLVKETRGITWPQFFIIVMIAASINYFFMTGHTLWEPTTSVTDHTATVTPSGQQHQSTEEINGPTSAETSTTLTAMPIITGDCVGYILAGSNEPTIMADPNNHAECLQAVKFMEAEEKRRRGPRYS